MIRPGQQWVDEIPDAEPVPAREHIYVALLLELGPPDIRWLLQNSGDSNTKYGKIRLTRIRMDLQCSVESLLLQFIHWYEQNQKTPTP